MLLPHPGPPPRRPVPDGSLGLSEEWIAGERDSEARINRPLYLSLTGLGLLAVLFLLLWTQRVLPASLAVGGVLACTAVAAPVAVALVQSRHVVAARLARVREQLETEREERERALHERQRDHARLYTRWQAATRAYEAQPRWYGVTVPDDTGAVVVVGGTDTGWSALLTTIGVSRLREGGDLTVVDLTGRSATRELVRLARRCAVAPRHWVLPADLPRMTLGTNLDAGQRARILSAVAAASGSSQAVDADETLLLRLLEVLGPRAGIVELIGGLRALLTPADDTAHDDPALARLSAEQRTGVRERCADTPGLRERAWALERRLSPFESVGTRGEEAAYAQVKIISTDRASGEAAARMYGTYAVAALSELLGDPGGTPAHGVRQDGGRTRTVVVCGAETLPGAEVDQVLRAASAGGAEVVLMFRTAVPEALERFSDPGCLPVVMRQCEGPVEAVVRAVAAAPGTAPHGRARLEVHRLSQVIGEALGGEVTEPEAGPEPEPEADDRFFSASHTESGAMIRNAAAGVSPLDLVRRVRSATSWGRATAQAAEIGTPSGTDGGEEPPVTTLGLDATSLRGLPCTAALVLGRRGPVLADTNPGILTLSTATLATVDDSRSAGAAAEAARAGGDRPRRTGGAVAHGGPGTTAGPAGGSGPDGGGGASEPAPPNLGPPPERLDWRV
ncbi:hypothetical protein [Nocardiopsis sp. CNT312]|uniref:hypothetical protein n=1 Tax=Nocardiopsis sp. CNT312 TaxID=1137268 RepID=UPI0004B19E53|nr:hypothetical protein [Nocardiopsis sp. CNT312]